MVRCIFGNFTPFPLIRNILPKHTSAMKPLLEGKVAVVTGGTRGIGYAIVRKYLQEGATVVLCGSRQATAEKALQQIKAEMPEARVDALWPDLTDLASVTAAWQQVVDRYGRLDILANNAGIAQSTPFYDYTEEEFDKIINLNVKAIFDCSQAAARFMKAQGGGCIIHTSSMVSLYGQPSGFAYPASQFAVNGITKSLARELGKDHIRVNAVAPGVVRTDMVANLPDEMIRPLVARIPLGRMAEADDIANAFLYLASDLAAYVSGTVLSVDGAAVV